MTYNKIVVVATWKKVLKPGSEECKIEVWENTNRPGGSLGKNPDPALQTIDTDGDKIHKVGTWSEVMNRDFEFGGEMARDKYEPAVSKTGCPGEGSVTLIDEANMTYWPGGYLYQVWRQYSGCPGEAGQEVRFMLLVNAHGCATIPAVGEQTTGGTPVAWSFLGPAQPPPHWTRDDKGAWLESEKKYAE